MITGEFYIILALKEDRDYSSFVTKTDKGHMIQGNIYDSTKFEAIKDILNEVDALVEAFPDWDFEVAIVSSKIFGKNPKFIYKSV